MAENPLYISSVPHNKPTLFELVAQESLMNTLSPSYELLCKVFKQKFKDNLNWFFNYKEEWYLFLNFLLQSHYMRHYNGSFSEVFYGLKRVTIPLNTRSEKLSNYSKIISLISLIALPYVNIKLKRIIEKYQLDIATDNIKPGKKNQIRSFIFIYKNVNAVYEIMRLYYLLGYLCGYTECHHPLLKLSKSTLYYNNIEIPTWQQLFTNKQKLSKTIIQIIFKFCSQFFEISAFTIQFLNWWHSDDVKIRLNSLPLPPPLNRTKQFNRSVCPICYQKRKVEVVLQSTGFVYCYRCIKDELDRNGKCPVTQLPARADQLVRIFTDK